ncbi:RdgB/HAM1 family non-canonical purine NTP pyrophosphatase [Ruminococcaceae bacterium OttesenSCG-928-I18]|nr:RdgB/HAM1 family non-canonical purine NTP pyrophosphatase [Ruminococcaceae bacterium OttesenSCG-928-I18]
MEFLIATNNKDKLTEMRRLLQAYGHTAISLEEAGISSMPKETGTTFAENALLKAKAACDASGMASIGDDSGLEVDALGGAPGVQSARFSGIHADNEANKRKLLQLLERTPFAKRTAHFVCVLALQMPSGAGMEVEGRCDGLIGFAESGENGFGYDPLFYVDGVSFADRTDEEKDAISHRAAAVKLLVEELPNIS